MIVTEESIPSDTLSSISSKRKKLEQLPFSSWPKGLERELAVVRAMPAELAARLNISFERSEDNFDTFDGALIRNTSGKCFALVRHLHDQAPGTMIWTMIESTSLQRDLREALSLLGMSETELIWVAKE